MKPELHDTDAGQSDARHGGARQPWQRPTLTAYGPIGKLTQGGSGSRSDGTQSKKK